MIHIPLIRSEDWNRLMDLVSRRLPIIIKTTEKKGWAHPWTITPTWDKDEKKWLFYMKPGFVNGVEVTAPTRVKYASKKTLDRLKDAGEKIGRDDKIVDALLTEWPRIEVGETRVIGTGAEGSISASVSSGIRVTYEPVPKFFADLGVTSANTEISGNLNSGITFKDKSEDEKKARRLRACDVSLWKDRPSAKFQVDPGNILAGIVGSIYITYSHLGGMKEYPYLRISPEFTPPIEPDSGMAMLEGITDPEYDTKKIATIYFVSPEGASPAAPLDDAWTPYVKYDQFWNLAHSPQSIPDSSPIEPIRLTTGLAGGLADIVIATILTPTNTLFNNALQILKSRNLKGAFWSL